jgi:peptide/nickel transport system permease protein
MSAAAAILSRANWLQHAAGALSLRSATLNLWVGGIIVGGLVAIALLAPWVAPYDPNEFDFRALSPGLGSSAHLFGTDPFGRDILSRVIYATRTDLLIGVFSALCPLLIGAAIGSLPGALGRWVDAVAAFDDVIDIAFPLVAVPIVFILGPGLIGFVAALSLVGWVSYARLVRTPALKARRLTAMACCVFALSDVALAVLVLVPLSYLGLGVQPPTVDWGILILMGLHEANAGWWLAGLAFVLLILGLCLFAQGLAERFGLRQS